MSAFKATFAAGLVVASVGLPFAVRHRQQVIWRESDRTFQAQVGRSAELSAENRRLSNLVAHARSKALSSGEPRELLQLRSEIGQLRQAAIELDQLRVMNHQFAAVSRSSNGQPAQPSAPPPRSYQVYWAKGQLAFAGYAQPAAALQTTLWAMSRNDADSLAASVTPEARSKLAREKWYNHGVPAEEIAAATRQIADSLNPSSGFFVVGEKVSSQDRADLDVYFEGEGKTRTFTMKKVGEEWRFDDLGQGTWP